MYSPRTHVKYKGMYSSSFFLITQPSDNFPQLKLESINLLFTHVIRTQYMARYLSQIGQISVHNGNF